MTTRRDFIKTGVAVAAGAAASNSLTARAAGAPAFPGVIYAAGDQGRWAGKAGSHAPVISRQGETVTITTHHPMTAGHYIVRHTLVLEDGTVAGAHTFAPTDKEAVSRHQLPAGYTGKLLATSFCNKHDFWLTEGR